MDYKAIGQRVRRVRKAKNMTQETLAELVNISTVYVSHIETGSGKPSLPIIVAIADALDVSVDALLYDEPRSGTSIAVDEIAAILQGCDGKQAAFIADIVRAAKASLDTYENK